jgi:hypothetical protein
MFKLDNSADAYGTSFSGITVTASYGELEALFGPAADSDFYKVSGEWKFVTPEGSVVALYDWKQTRLYAEDLPFVSEFRSSDEKHTFHVGAADRDDARHFFNYVDGLLARLARSTSCRRHL